MDEIIKKLAILLKDESESFSYMRDFTGPVRGDDAELKQKSKQLSHAANKIEEVDLEKVESKENLLWEVKKIISYCCQDSGARGKANSAIESVFDSE